ncbi:SulP family inorganic anion transporter [Ruminococcus flavefaciens]|uniref:SulP family inorganic anion transporter n=1 Tax=Ruminococcus flavefaciens TaxID=1265 RepID=UPI000684EC02|nr:SulP family inorganic anion transporter [Ruminococcus flavefaciens]
MKLKDITAASAAKDIFTGIIIALVSIPISMGYAQVSGLPAVYGLYGSIFPILIFGLLSTSKQFIFGVDAAPAALVGAFLATLGIESGSAEAVQLVPVISFFVGVWLLLMALFRAGRVVSYISTPVMGGFISGISTTIIFMQIPKILGGTGGRGEIVELAEHIVETCAHSFNATSAILGGAALAVLLISKKLMPRLPMSVFVMIGGAVLGWTGFAESRGVALLENVERGLPAWRLPHFSGWDLTQVLTTSLTVAVVIMAETLLASSSYAAKNGYKLKNDREILAYGLGNIAASMTGCCPVNGSVSRSAMGEQYGGKSQIMSIAASFSMMLIMLFGTGFIKYLPVPILTAIVVSALLGAVEFHLMKRLFRQDKRELFIFFGAFFGVLIFGTVYGVMTGVILSFISLILNVANPKRSFLGVIEGHEGFHSLERNTYAYPVKGAVLYRFSGNLYFANINIFISDIESALKDDTRVVVVDSGAVCNIDITAADRIAELKKLLDGRGIKLYFASHIGSLNDRFRRLGLGSMVEEGHCRRTIPAALLDAGFTAPYDTENDKDLVKDELPVRSFERLEFEWAFGSAADEEMEKYAEKLLVSINSSGNAEEQLTGIINADENWKGMGELDREELLVHLESHLKELSEKLHISEERIEEAIELRKLRLAKSIGVRDPKALKTLREHDRRFVRTLKKHDSKLYEKLLAHRREALDNLRKSNPEFTDLIDDLYKH